MGQVAENIGQIWHGFTPTQRRNIAIYIVGIMCYKFALEYYNGSFITQANERFGDRRFTAIGLLTGLNYAAQAIGSIIVAPLAKRFPTRSILACAVFAFGLISAIPLIADAATGGQMKQNTANGKDKYGSWDPNGLYPIYVVSGLAYGCVEIIRRIIPRDLVGGDPHRLKRMDALVHILYEVAGTTGAFTSASLIGKFGYNYSAFLSPILFSLAGVLWFFISSLGESRAAELALAREKAEKEGRLEEYDAAYEASRDKRTVLQKLTCRGRSKQPAAGGLAGVEQRERGSLLSEMGGAVRSFGKAFWYGGYLVLTNRKFIWLLPAYTLALYGHRYLENGLGPIWAKSVAGTSSFSQILTGGSNLGELCGALSVLLFTNAVKTPLPWLRLDAIALNLVWVLPFFPVERNQVVWAWRLAAVFLPISFGWAAGDVSLSAHIQATLARMSNLDGDVSPLGAIMAFLYTMYIIIYAVLSAVLGRVVDRRLSGLTGAAAVTAAQDTLKYVGGVHFTILSVIIFAATFIPRGAVALNPSMIDEADFENDTESAGGDDFTKPYGKDSHSEDEVSEKGLHFDPQSNNLENSAAGILAQNSAAVAAMPTK